MTKKSNVSRITKAVRGISYGDVSNHAVRNILGEISQQIIQKENIDLTQHMSESLDFFDGKCPYTGEYIRSLVVENSSDVVIDHIVPINRVYCGLNLPGNLVWCKKEANSKKRDQSAEEFLMEHSLFKDVQEEERIERVKKIKEFQKEFKYNPQEYQELFSEQLTRYYEQIRQYQENKIKELFSMIDSLSRK